MSILKGILHHWNKTTKSYDTIHPETESAQVTDWNQGIVNTLASTALGTLVNTLTSDSLLATMIQKVLTATGVKYNMAQNGYICLGSLFGGLIIQWVYDTVRSDTNVRNYNIALPLSMSAAYTAAVGSTGDDLTNVDAVNKNSITVHTAMSLSTLPEKRVRRHAYFIIIGAL